jgi:hypothetical protein
MEYRISKSAKILTIIIAIALSAGGLYFISRASHPTASWPAPGSLLLAAILIGIAALMYLDASRLLLTVDKHTLTLVRLFSTRSILLEEIEGYRSGDKDAFYILLKDGGKAIQLPQNLERRKELIEWFQEKYEDVDARERDEETAVLLESEQFGSTVEERSARLEMAGKFDNVASVVAVGAFFWSLFYPRPYEAMMIILLLLPWIAVYATWYFKGLLRLYKKKNSPYPSVVQLMIFTTAATLVNVLRGYDIYRFGKNASSILVAGTLLASAVCIVACRQAIAATSKKTLTYCCIVVLAGMYCYSLLIFSNCYYDQSEPEIWQVEIMNKRISKGKSTSYYLSLSPWGRFTDGKEVSVPKGFYQEVNKEDSVRVFLKKGKWDVPWYWVER